MPVEESGAPDVDRSQSKGDDGRLIPTERLRDDLDRVIEALGRAPTTAEYDERGDYSFLTVANRLGDGAWYEAIRAVGHAPATHVGSEIPEATLRADLRRVVDEQEGTPTMAEYNNRGEFTAETVANRLGSGTWAEALATVGHEADPSPGTIPEAALREDLHRVIDELGRAPSYGEYDACGTYSAATVARRLGDGSWTDAICGGGDDT